MDRDMKETGDLRSEDQELIGRTTVSRVFDMETLAILDSKAGFERLMRALDDRRDRQRRRRRLFVYLLGAATVIIGLMGMLRLLQR
jgi:hypothetical protein